MDIYDILSVLDGMAGTNVSGAISDIIMVIACVAMIVGAVQCFFGFRLFRFFTAVAGFFVGGLIGLVVAGISGSGEGGLIFCTLVCACLGAWLAYTLYKLGVFLACYAAGFLVGLCLGLLMEDVAVGIVLGLILGLVIGIIGVKLVRPVIILCTGISGGLSAGSAFAMMVNADSGVGIAVGVILAVLGCIYQFKSGSKPQTSAATMQNPGGAAPAAIPAAAPVVSAVRESRADSNLTVLTSLHEHLWVSGLPVLIRGAEIIRKNGEAGDDVYFRIAIQNLASAPIVGVFFDIRFSDLLGTEICSLDRYAIQDVRIARGERFSVKDPVRIPDANARKFRISVKNVVFEDGTVWNNENGLELQPMIPAEKLALSPELMKEFYRKAGGVIPGRRAESMFTFRCADRGDHWICACGQMNLDGTCLSCGAEKEAVFALSDEAALEESLRVRLEEEQRIREERQQKIDAQKEAVKQFASGVAAQTGAALKKGGEVAKSTSVLLMDKGKELGSKIAEEHKQRVDSARRTAACAHCGKPLDADAKFCAHCGTAVVRADEGAEQAAKPIFCPSCGKKLKESAKFCDGCGTKVQ